MAHRNKSATSESQKSLKTPRDARFVTLQIFSDDPYLLIPLPVPSFRRFCHLRLRVTLLSRFSIITDASLC